MTEAPTKIIIKNGLLVNHDYVISSDILIENGKILKIEPDIVDDSCDVIDAKDMLVFPGGVDSEAYLNALKGGAKSPENYLTGSKAALCGGTTTIVNCVEVSKDENLKNRIESEISEASKDTACNIAFQASLPDFSSNRIEQLKELIQNGSVVPSIRLSTVNKGEHIVSLDDGELYDAFCWCRDNKVFPCVLAENDKLIKCLEKEMHEKNITGPEGHYMSRNERVEEEAIFRVLTISGQANCPIHLTRVYSNKSVSKASKFRTNQTNKPLILLGTNLASFMLTSNSMNSSDWSTAFSHVTLPSLKHEDGCIMDNCLNQLDLVSSGHLVFNLEQKACGKDDFRLIVPGTGGIQRRMPLLWEKAVKNGLLEKSRFVNLTSTIPAKLHGLYPEKGTLSIGSDADIVIWSESDTFKPWPCIESGNLDPFANLVCKAGPEYVILGGKIVLKPGTDVSNLQGGSGKVINLCSEHPRELSMSAVFQQAQLLKRLNEEVKCVAILRDPYTGPVADATGCIPSNKDKVILYSDMVDSDDYKRSKGQEVKEALPPGQRVIRTSVKTAQPPGGGSSQSNWWG